MDQLKNINLSPHLSYYYGFTHSLKPEELILGDHPFREEPPRGEQLKEYWARFSFRNETRNTEWVLENKSSRVFTTMDLYKLIPRIGFKKIQEGSDFQGHFFSFLNSLFFLTLEERGVYTFYLHIRQESPESIRLDLKPRMIFENSLKYNHLYYGFLFGIFFTMIIFNFCLFLSIKDISYLYYVLFFFFLGLSRFFFYGLPGELMKSSIPFPHYMLLLHGSIVFFVLFSRSYLMIARYFPLLDRSFLVSLGIVLFSGFLGVLFPFHWGLMIPQMISHFLLLLVAMGSSFFIYSRGFKAAFYYFLSLLSTVLLGLLAFIFNSFLFFFDYIYLVDFVCIVLLIQFALSLGNRLNLVRHEKEKAQKQVIKSLSRMGDMKDRFLDRTSHELRNPVYMMIGLAQTLSVHLAEKGKEQVAYELETLDLIIRRGQMLVTMVNDILDYARIKNNELHLITKAVSIYQITDIVIKRARSSLKKKKIELINDIPQEISLVSGDENRLQQIMQNLIGNAIKFTEKGFIRVLAVETDNLVHVTVMDTGVGIKRNKLNAIFHSFEQADTSYTREYGGAGLGLTLTKQLVEMHGGAIWVDSEEGKGTAFTFTLPRVTGESTQHRRKEAAPARSKTSVYSGGLLDCSGGMARKIVVVDDDASNLKIMKKRLENEGFVVKAFGSSFKVLKAVDEGYKPDLIVIDLEMPQVTGFEVCREIRKKHPFYALPIIIITPRNQVASLSQAVEEGANDFIVKPYPPRELISRIFVHLTIARGNSAFSRFALPELADVLGKKSLAHVLPGEGVRRKFSIVYFHFFNLEEQEPEPEGAFSLMNTILAQVGTIIRVNKGFIIHYLGTGFLALFPVEADQAVKTCLSLMAELNIINKNREDRSLGRIEASVALHRGEAFIGTVGDSRRLAGTLFGSAVTYTIRLADISKKLELPLLISEGIHQAMIGDANVVERFLGFIKEGEDLQPVYEVIMQDSSLWHHKMKTRVLFEEAVMTYYNKDFRKAGELFRKLLEVQPGDTLAAYYEKRCRRNLESGLPEQWDSL